ncbi:hypothetical protein SprV_0200740000 [Sparganum proliferum]
MKTHGRSNQTRNRNLPLPPPPPRRPTHQTGRVSPLTLAAWNVHSLLDNPRSNRPEWRTALLARELARYKVDIAAPSETRFSEQGQLEEVGAGDTFLWSGRPRAERRDADVAFAIWNDIVGRLPCLPQGINDRLMNLRLPLRRCLTEHFQGVDQEKTVFCAGMQEKETTAVAAADPMAT